jgi:hydroxymethylbilane synthase
MTQSRWVADRIEKALPGQRVSLVVVRTSGDRDSLSPLSEIGGMGVFTRELDRALLAGEVDLCVHSLKDLPTVLDPGIALVAVPVREDTRDILVGREGTTSTLATLPRGSVVGTGSMRRAALVRATRRDLEVAAIRGNLDTRIRQVDDGSFAATILAAAGLRRMGWSHRISEVLDLGGWLPAPGQGALAVVVREENREAHASWTSVIDHPGTRSAVAAERAVLHVLEAGCQLPVGALGVSVRGALRLRALVVSPDGRQLVRAEGTGLASEPWELAERVARQLESRGAREILAELYAGMRKPEREGVWQG